MKLPARIKLRAKVSVLQSATTFIVANTVLVGITSAVITIHPKKPELPPIKTVEAKESPKPESLEDHIKRLWQDKSHIMIAIAKAESGFRCNAINPRNRNGTWDAGLFQINQIHGFSKEELLDCHKNIDIAYKVYKKQGLRAWSVYNSGKYRRFL